MVQFYTIDISKTFREAHFGEGNGPIHLDDVQCTGDETCIFNCQYTTNHNCDHYEDVGIRCSSELLYVL